MEFLLFFCVFHDLIISVDEYYNAENNRPVKLSRTVQLHANGSFHRTRHKMVRCKSKNFNANISMDHADTIYDIDMLTNNNKYIAWRQDRIFNVRAFVCMVNTIILHCAWRTLQSL